MEVDENNDFVIGRTVRRRIYQDTIDIPVTTDVLVGLYSKESTRSFGEVVASSIIRGSGSRLRNRREAIQGAASDENRNMTYTSGNSGENSRDIADQSLLLLARTFKNVDELSLVVRDGLYGNRPN